MQYCSVCLFFFFLSLLCSKCSFTSCAWTFYHAWSS